MLGRIALTLAALCVAASAGAFTLYDDFESYDLGEFPEPMWLDVGLVDPTPPNPPDPSCYVENVFDAFGNETQALFLGEWLAPSSGIYTWTTVDRYYEIAADVRVDRFSDEAGSEPSDWAVGVGFNKFEDGLDPASWVSGQIYASVLTGGWRLWVAGAEGAFADIDLGLPVSLDSWARLQLNIDAETGSFHSRIWDVVSGDLLLDRTDLIEGWTPADGLFDVAAIFDGELTEEATIPNLAYVDNVFVEVVPEPAFLPLVAAGVLGLAVRLLRRA